jgi:hypothetical protein
VQKAENIPAEWWNPMEREPKDTVKTCPRQRPENVKDRIVKEKALLNLRLKDEEVGEFGHQPTKCSQPYQMVALRKNISREQGELMLIDEIRYFFYISAPCQAAEVTRPSEPSRKGSHRRLCEHAGRNVSER